MRKHILKKFLNEVQLSPEVVGHLDTIRPEKLDPKELKKAIDKRFVPYITTDKGVFLKAFVLRINNVKKILPEPDPVLLYFHTAYVSYKSVIEKKKEITEKVGSSQSVDGGSFIPMDELLQDELYQFFGAAASCAILLWTAMEAMINRCIPKDFEFRRDLARKTEIFSKRQIEETMSFDEKVSLVLPKATGKSFIKDHPPTFTHLSNLKEFRNMIVHTREAEGQTSYDHLYKKAFDFKYDETLDAVKDFCNYYHKENFIEECSCSKDW